MEKLKLKLKAWTTTLSFLMLHGMLFAQNNGGAAIDKQLLSWKKTIGKSLNVAVAVFALGGGFIIFLQYMQGNDQAQKNFVKFAIGLGIFALIDAIVQIFIQ